MLIKPKQALLDWAHAWDENRYTLDEIRRDSTAYLIPECELVDEQTLILASCYPFIFEAELFSWHTDAALWPTLDLETFLEWFDVEFHSLVIDLDDTPLEYADADSEPQDTLDPDSNGN